MHPSSLQIMESLRNKYLNVADTLSIVDIGSYDVTQDSEYPVPWKGNYRHLFEVPGKWTYTGVDLGAGPNVDAIAHGPYNWPFPANTFDVLISGQCLEHVEAPWLWIQEAHRVLKVGGKALIIAPWGCGEHRYPIDCWRIFPDGMRFLLKYGRFEVIEADRTDVAPHEIGDCWGVCMKKENL